MAITFSGLATGLDTDSIVKQIMDIERAPIDRLTKRKDNETERLNAFFQLKGKLDDLKSAASAMSLTSEVRSTKATLSSESAFTASTESAALGSYDIAVAQLAQVQKTITSGFSSKTSAILGAGTITVNGVDITVDASNNSLSGLAESINAVSKDTGVSVSIIQDGSDTNPYHLVFTGKDANTSFAVSANLTNGQGAVAFDTTLAKSAQQAVAFIDGIKVVSDSNTITDAISGVTLNLGAVSQMSYAGTTEAGVPSWDWADPPVYSTTKLDVTADTDTLKEKVTGFVTAYNAVIKFINSGYEDIFGGGAAPETTTDKNSSDATSDSSGTTDTEKLLGSVLRGDATVQGVKRQLQSVLTDSVHNNGAFSILSQIGITSQVDGTLKQDNTKLDKALAGNFDDMVALLSGEGSVDGVMKKFNSMLLKMASPSSGMYANQKKAYDAKVDNIDDQISVLESRMTKRESTLRAQFTAMEQLISGLNAQGDFLSQQIANLNKKE